MFIKLENTVVDAEKTIREAEEIAEEEKCLRGTEEGGPGVGVSMYGGGGGRTWLGWKWSEEGSWSKEQTVTEETWE